MITASAQNRHDNNAHAIAELKLPGCEGSWFSPECRHLRYTDWTIVLPVVKDMLHRMTMDSIWQLLKNGSLTSRLHDPAFADSLNTWLAVLGNAGFVTFMCGGVAKRLHDPAFADSLNTWLAVLGNAGFVTFMCGGVAKRLHDPAFTDSLNTWLAVLGNAGFVTFMCNAIAELKLPGCEGSWFSPECRHLRYTDWTIVLPVVKDMLHRMTMDSIWQLLKNGSLTSHHSYRVCMLGVLQLDRGRHAENCGRISRPCCAVKVP